MLQPETQFGNSTGRRFTDSNSSPLSNLPSITTFSFRFESNDQHGVTEAKEAIPLLDSFVVGPQDMLSTSKGTY